MQNSEPPNAAAKFIASMTMDFDKWHDGTGYNLAALAQVPAADLPAIEAILLAKNPVDWRDIEALARIDTPAARAAVQAAVKNPDASVRREAMQHVPAEAFNPADREARLLDALQSNDVFGNLSQAIDEAAEFHPPAVVDLLIHGARDRPGPTAVHFAALLYYIHGKADAPFDWDQRPFFLRFDADTPPERLTVFKELCATIGVDAAKYEG